MCFGRTRLLWFVPGMSCDWRTGGEHGSLSFLCTYLTHEQEAHPDIQRLSALAKVLWPRSTLAGFCKRAKPLSINIPFALPSPLSLHGALLSLSPLSPAKPDANTHTHTHTTPCSHHPSTLIVPLHPSIPPPGYETSHPSSSPSPTLAPAGCGKYRTPMVTWKFVSSAHGEDEFLHDQDDAGRGSIGVCPSVQ